MEARHSSMLIGPVQSGIDPPDAVRLPDGRQVLLVTGYKQARSFLTDPSYSRSAATGSPPVGPASAMSMTELDPPRHTFIRGVVSHMFSARAVQRKREQIERRAADLVQSLAKSGSPVDLVSSFCAPFSFSVHCDLLGVPAHARTEIRALSIRRSGRPGASVLETYQAELALQEAVSDALNYVRNQGGDGVFAELIAMHERSLLTDSELTGIASSLFFDGHLLASAQIANAVLSLLCHPDQLRLLIGNPSALLNATEELLRWNPSITLGMPRMASTSANIGDRCISPGQIATVAFGIVNRDRTIFAEPERLDVRRSPNRHLSFGAGIHHCLGAHLMRMELHTALVSLLASLPGLKLAVDEDQIEWSASHTIRMLLHLPIQW